MATLFNEILYAIRGRCISDESASVAAAEVAELVEEKFTTTNTGSPKLSGAVCRWCYGHKDMCAKCVFGSEFSPAAQHRANA